MLVLLGSFVIVIVAGCGDDGSSVALGNGSNATPAPDATTTTPAPTPTPPAATQGTQVCGAVYSCANSCSPTHSACIDACLIEGTTDARSATTALLSCEQKGRQGTCLDACAAGGSVRCDQCLQPLCGPQAISCFGGAGYPAPVASDGCRQVHACAWTCGLTDVSCQSSCFGIATVAEQQSKASALLGCEQNARKGVCAAACAGGRSYSCDQCLLPQCNAQASACFGAAAYPPPPPPPTTTSGGSCESLHACVRGCKPDDAACRTSCLSQGGEAAQNEANSLLSCEQTARGGACLFQCFAGDSSQCDQCLLPRCSAQAIGCFGAAAYPTTTDASCEQVHACSRNCKPDDTACHTICLGKGTPDAQAEAGALLGCEQQARSGGCLYQCFAGNSAQCDQCLLPQCTAQVGGCFGKASYPGTAAVPSGKSCDQTRACADGCWNIASCEQHCRQQASATAVLQLDAYQQCQSKTAKGQCSLLCTIPGPQCTLCIDQFCGALCP